MQDIFKRIEIKYLISEEIYNEFRKRVETRMEDDEYGLSKISSIYYDSENYDVIRESMEKPPYKEKLRLRAYGDVTNDSKVYLELKKKYDGVVYKRRTSLKYGEALNYLNKGIKPYKSSQILDEIDYFIRFHNVSRGTLIEYERIASYGCEDKELRITYDSNIKAAFDTYDFNSPGYKNSLLKEGERLMEIKVPGAMPLWLTEILSELKIYPVSFSKYGTASNRYLQFDMIGERKC